MRNRGTALVRHFIVTFAVKQFAGTQFSYAAGFLPCTAAACGFDLTAPGATTVVKTRWPRSAVPAAGSHGCLLAAVLTRSDKPGAGLHVWEHNNLAQKNLTIVDVLPNRVFTLPFIVSNALSKLPRNFKLELIRPTNLPALQASFIGMRLPRGTRRRTWIARAQPQ